MDFATLVGVVVAIGMILFGILLGSPLRLFWDTPSALIVFGGTIGVILISYPIKDVLGVAGVVKNAFLLKRHEPHRLINVFVDFATRARREGILSLEKAAENVKDPFLRQGLELVIDGIEPQSIRDILESEIEHLEERHRRGSEILNSVGQFAPAIGMLGTLVGLVQMLQSMSDPSSIGPAMAVALITTFYGAMIANLFALPMAGKLTARSFEESLVKGMIVEGVMAISSGDNPRIVEKKLHAYIAPVLRESLMNKGGA